MLRFEAVGLRYERNGAARGTPAAPEVLHDISFRLDAGAFRWLLGPSGAGKTSLLRLLYLAVRPTREGLFSGHGCDDSAPALVTAAASKDRRGLPGFSPAAPSLCIR